MNGEQKSPWPLVLVLLATALAYLRALGGELVYDDLQMIERNPLIRDLGNVPRMFGQGYWDFLGEANASYNGYWRPLTAISLALAYAVGGGSTEVFHAACLLVHLAATGLAYALALRLSRERAVAFFTALLFGLHPVHVESVAWITALNDPLFGLFGLAALFAFAGWRERGSPGLPLAAALWFAVALLAKELAVAVLPMLVALDLFRRRAEGEPAGLLGGLRAPARTYGTLGAVLLAYYLARVAVFGSPAAGLDRITTYFGVGFGRLALLRVELLGGGLGLLAWPVDLNVFRPFHPVLAATSPVVIGAALALAAFVALAAWEWRRGGRLELLALLVMPAGILPILLRVASLGRFPLSDRFLYLPVVGFALYATLVARRLLPPRTAGAALTLVAGLYAWGTYARIGVWANEEALFRSAVTADPRSAYAHWGLGRVLLDHYNETEDDAALAEAFVVYQRAQALVEEVLSDPESDLFISSADVLQINLGFGWCLVAEAVNDEYHDFDTPAALFEQLLTRIYEIRENAEEARKQGLQVLVEPLEVEQVHVALGVTHMLARRYTKAETSFRQALAENESYPEAHSNFGRLLADLGEFDRARHHFERALELRPDGYEDRLMLARALFERGWYERAEELARELNDEDPREPEAMMVLASLKARLAKHSEALVWVDKVLEAEPEHGYAWFVRAGVLIKLNESQEAIRSFRRATELLPDNFEAQYNFGAYLLQSGALDSATPYLVQAYGLCRDASRYLQIRETLLQLPVAADSAVTLGAIDRSRGQWDAALTWLDRALAAAPANGELLFQKGRVLRDRGDLPGAADVMASACDALPDAFVPHFELGLVLNELLRFPEALERLRSALAIGPPASWSGEQARNTVARIEEVVRALEAGQQGPLFGPPATPGG